jgi:deoxyribose-phosphate aldolase
MQLPKPLNKYIDHTLLKPNATHGEFEQLLDEAIKYQFASVCISPYMVAPVVGVLGDSDIKVCTVVGFPHGNVPLQTKAHDILLLAKLGADEIDFVINYGDLISGLYESVGIELEYLDRVCREAGVVSKCILETCYLTSEEINFMFTVINDYTQIDYIKTSTGFGPEGAQLGNIMDWNAKRYAWMNQNSNNLIKLTPVNAVRQHPIKIKAAGGIRDLNTALKFIAVGADRLGMSTSVKVMEEYRESQNEPTQTFTGGEETP